MLALVAVGAVYLDTILSVDHFPAEDEKLRASRHEKRRGGNVPNTLEVIQQLVNQDPVRLVLLSILPSSSSLASQQIRSSLDPQVDFSHCIYREHFSEAPSSYIIRSLTTDSRTIVNYNDLPEMTAEEFSHVAESISEDALVYHFEGRIPDVTAKCIRYLRNNHPNTKISVEAEKQNRPGLQELVNEADVAFYSKTWAKAQGYQNPKDCLYAQANMTKRPSYLCCTWGEEGAAALKLPDMSYCQCPAFTSNEQKVVDTIGAGDTFIAGMLYGLFYGRKNWGLEQTLQFASELAGRKVTQQGFAGLGEAMNPWL